MAAIMRAGEQQPGLFRERLPKQLPEVLRQPAASPRSFMPVLCWRPSAPLKLLEAEGAERGQALPRSH